jgi:hypothetical protein
MENQKFPLSMYSAEVQKMEMTQKPIFIPIFLLASMVSPQKF